MTREALRQAVQGVRGFVLAADGVLVLHGAPLPGSIDALHALGARGIPFRVVTNFSQFHRDSLAAWFGTNGLAIDPGRIITGTSATAAYTASTLPGRPLFVLAAVDALREFAGQHLLTADEADAAPPGTVAAVVIGDAGDELSYRNIDVAFRLVRGGEDLLAMHRNPW
jgi:ribonucleotide monophosphatase NagD (HAD superfamily)